MKHTGHTAVSYDMETIKDTEELTTCTDLPGEEWKPIEATSGAYQISNYGRCKRSANNRLITATTQPKGYNYVALSVNGKNVNFRLHRLVAVAFVPNPQNKKEVNHIDGDKSNNSADNLEWATHSENVKHAFTKGLKEPNKHHPTQAERKHLHDVQIEIHRRKGHKIRGGKQM